MNIRVVLTVMLALVITVGGCGAINDAEEINSDSVVASKSAESVSPKEPSEESVEDSNSREQTQTTDGHPVVKANNNDDEKIFIEYSEMNKDVYSPMRTEERALSEGIAFSSFGFGKILHIEDGALYITDNLSEAQTVEVMKLSDTDVIE